MQAIENVKGVSYMALQLQTTKGPKKLYERLQGRIKWILKGGVRDSKNWWHHFWTNPNKYFRNIKKEMKQFESTFTVTSHVASLIKLYIFNASIRMTPDLMKVKCVKFFMTPDFWTT